MLEDGPGVGCVQRRYRGPATGSLVKIEDYAIIGDTQTAALVGRTGSIDWLCVPRFDSPACLASLVGTEDNGFWRIAPAEPSATRRRYRPGTLVLETVHDTPAGSVRVIDCMPIRGAAPDVVRVVEGLEGRVRMRMDLVIRFDYGSTVPWVRRAEGALRAIGGPDALELRTPVDTHGEGLATVAEFDVAAGERVPFVLTWHPSHEPPPEAVDAAEAVAATTRWWTDWSDRCETRGPYRDEVLRSLITLKALTHAPTGGLVAAATTSLPEDLGGVRNWDYRYCWLRDATFSLYALLLGGYEAEAVAWRDWLLRATAGAPEQMHIMYGPAGERRLPELELDWLEGYEGSRPVRIGNAASRQFQLDVYGEVMDCLHQARRAGVSPDPFSWQLQRALMEFLEGHWRDPDEGIWEVRGPRRHFTHSKVMAWVAADRAVKAVELFGLDGPAQRWRSLREEIRADVCRHGFDADRGAFTQSYGRPELDASLLMLPLVGFLDARDPRMVGTVAAIEAELLGRGFVHRYADRSFGEIDGLPGGEGAFLPCSFWLADNYLLQGRVDEGRALFQRLCGLANDVGLLSEEYDTVRGRLVGNFPQAFTHVALVNTAHNLGGGRGPARARGDEER
ncbi:MAG: glycoside hydrolase family 15 protein [Actinobacteria bacterium]|nr:glycoside hydrolase family 15 protein [Actinomycetota bacterium]